ncbi:YihY/virulence factor BrkB family protein [Streptomyces sp. NBC_01381]|uniref:YhjD/YihY/BrkB family envelope integrity protein n=1 Tax=Streptomyces sp. NBC_01381 TaxID=2903845 RepID=UPI002254BCC9|nr:YhjD/YihY/BrkB family envelope integrity protein [Streptomyces sp. NBC_01381]MCX4665456.1 YihY/virulence factor BrkB family protein [Streptomyces sp. NBC_01381]
MNRKQLRDWARAAQEFPRRTPLVGRMLARLISVRWMDASARLAAQLFLAALPLLIVVAAFAPSGVKDLLADSVQALLGGDAPVDTIEQSFTAQGVTKDTYGGVGLVVALISATALSRALQQVCERCWDLPKGGARVTAWRWLVWLAGWLTAVLFQAPLRHGFGAGTWLGVLLSLVTAVLLWWWTQHLLLGARIRWAPLLPGAVLTGVGMVTFAYLSGLFMPAAMKRSLAQFGSLGYVFTLLSWLIAACCVIVAGIGLGQVTALSGPFPRWLGSPAADARDRPPAGGRPSQGGDSV